jgi:predicted dehydrogenase
MLDYLNWLCGTPVSVLAAATPAPPDVASVETASITVTYADGSVGTVHYSGLGAASMPKERVEVLRGGRSWVLDDFASLTSYGPGGAETTTTGAGDKGHAALLAGVLRSCRGREPFRPGLASAYSAQSVALGALESIASGSVVLVRRPGDER